MREVDKTKPVLVTGATGYIASWVIKQLLDQGISVNATVRDLTNPDRVEYLKAMSRTSTGELNLFKADLLDEGSFDAAMQDCELVLHMASPFYLSSVKNPEQALIRPAQEGTRNVLSSAKKSATVKRVVVTSSVAAVFGDNEDIRQTRDGVFDETHWNTTSDASHQPYSYSKTIAEKTAWAIAGEQDQWDLLVINPGWVLGPSLSKRTDSASIKTMIEFGNGTFRAGVPELHAGVVDVRDVAAAHIKAGFTPGASGRHILVSDVVPLMGIAGILKKHFGDSYPFPRMQAPKFLFWLLAPMYDRTREYVSKNIGIKVSYDTSYSRNDLGITYTPIEQTVKDHFQQIVNDGLLKQ